MKSRPAFHLRFAFYLFTAAFRVEAADMDSVYLTLPSDVVINGEHKILLSQFITVQESKSFLLVSDGIYAPISPGTANSYIIIDGVKVSNDSLINWGESRAPVAHSFRAIAALKLSAGKHKIDLVSAGSAHFIVKASSNLSIMANPAVNVQTIKTTEDSKVITLHTAGLVNGKDPLPIYPLSAISLNDTVGPVVALASGRSYFAGEAHAGSQGYGDAMWTISFNGLSERNNNSTYSDNDLCLCAEVQAPMFVQAFAEKVEKIRTVELNASVFPWGNAVPGIFENGVQYKVGEGTALVVLSGGMTVAGKTEMVGMIDKKEQAQFNRTPYLCISSDQKWPRCPPIDSDVRVISEKIDIPVNHNGIVFFSALTRIQGDRRDKGGKFRMWLVIDGKRVGSEGGQVLAEKYGVSTRTISVSYLAAGSAALVPGEHVIELYVRGTGSFMHLSITRDMPLMWFD